MSDYAQLDQILGVSFGSAIKDLGCILVDFRVRTRENGRPVEGKRGGVVVAHSVLAQIQAHAPELRDAIEEQGADRDVLDPPLGPVPAWNEGPTLEQAAPLRFVCNGFGVRDIAPEQGSIIVVLDIGNLGYGPEHSHSADYLMPVHVFEAMVEVLPKVLRKIEQKGMGPKARTH